MKKQITVVTIMFVLAFRPGHAQDSTLRYGGMQQLGLSFNAEGIDAHIAFINGIRYGRFFAGIGVNPRLESSAFRWNTTTLYLDGRYYLGKSKQFFGKLNGGVNLITGRMENEWGGSWDWREYSYQKKPGLYCAAGAGVKLALGKNFFYSFDVAYSFLQMRYAERYINVFNAAATDHMDVRQGAIVLQLGFEFN